MPSVPLKHSICLSSYLLYIKKKSYAYNKKKLISIDINVPFHHNDLFMCFLNIKIPELLGLSLIH